jgi:hypothetical protein
MDYIMPRKVQLGNYYQWQIKINGEVILHNPDGPAVINEEPPNRYKEWCINGKVHREDGPALVYEDNPELNEWWYHGKHIPCSSQEEFERLIKLKAFW